MIFTRLNLAALGLTLLVAAFIAANADLMGGIFWHLLSRHDLPAAALMAALLLGGQWVAVRRQRAEDWIAALPGAVERHRYTVAAVLWGGLCAASVFVYHNHPLSMDEYAAVFQAKVFAAGALHGQFPPELLDALIPRGFQNHFLMVNRDTGAVFSAYWPGFSLLLTPFVALDVPWACNPTLVTASFLLIGRLARDVAPGTAAPGWALLFALASPAFLANGISYYAMSAHLLANLAFAWLLLTPTPLRLWLAGLLGGFALVLHNPFPHLVFALPWLVWLACRRERRLRDLGWLVLGYLPVLAVLGAGWSLWQRDMLRPAGTAIASVAAAATTATMAAAAPPELPSAVERLLGLARGFLRFVQRPTEAIVWARLAGLAKLWLWSAPLLLLLAWWGARRARAVAVRLLGASALLTFFAYFTIRFDQGHGWGYRYFHSAWGVLPVLAALGMLKLVGADGLRAARPVALLALCSLVAANALRVVQIENFVAAHLANFPPRVAGERLVLHNGRGYYANDLIQNDPWLRGDEKVFLMVGADTKAAVLRHFPGAYTTLRNRHGETLVREGTSRGP